MTCCGITRRASGSCSRAGPPGAWPARSWRGGAMRERDRLATVKRRLHDRLLQRIDANGLAAARPVDRRLLVREEALAILREEGHLLPQGDLARVVNDVSDRVVGLGPIESLLRDPEVSEVMT